MEGDKLLHSVIRLLARQELLILSLLLCLDQQHTVTKEQLIATFERLMQQGSAERLTDQMWLRIQQEQDKPWDLGDLFK
ncbi:MAG: hypothetical protein ACT4OO_12895 [Nitrospiraceae bacterium]